MSMIEKAGGATATFVDERVGSNKWLKKNLNKIFPDHWSFMLGEIALYSFIVLLLSGTFLTFWFRPSMVEVIYNGSYEPLNGIQMSEAYASTIGISFDIRGGLLMRQVHHWAALIFVIAIMVHLCRVFFTGAFRKPRELNWIIGANLLILGIIEGFIGYSLPDDLLSGTGLRITQGIMQGIPLVGTYLAFFLFGGEFPGSDIIPRFYTIHVLLDPRDHPGPDHGSPAADLVPEAHPVPRPGPDQRQRGGLPAAAGLHGQGRRLLLRRLRRLGGPLGHRHDQPGVDVRAVQPVPDHRRRRNPTGTWASWTARCA